MDNLVKTSCMVCGESFLGPDPKLLMCCSGRDCGCMGQPTEPIVCSDECYLAIINRSNERWEASKNKTNNKTDQ